MAWLSWVWGALPFLCMFSIQTEQFVSTRVAAKRTACTHLIPDIWFWLAWQPSSLLFPLRFIEVLTISKNPWGFLHADFSQQAGWRLNQTLSLCCPQLEELHVCTSAPPEHPLSTAVGSGQLAHSSSHSHFWLSARGMCCMSMEEFLLTQCVCVPEPDLISEPLRHGLRLTRKKPQRDPPVSTHRQKWVSCLQARIFAFHSSLRNSALPLLLYSLPSSLRTLYTNK